MSREDQLYGIASALRAVVDDGSMAYSMEANHYNDPYGYFLYCAQHPVPDVPGPPPCVWTFWASPMSM